jgi:hypothetical protein
MEIARDLRVFNEGKKLPFKEGEMRAIVMAISKHLIGMLSPYTLYPLFLTPLILTSYPYSLLLTP